jgi:hypothetical protein
MDASIKKFFWLRAQPLVHCLLDLFIGPERLASHRLFEWTKHMKITGGEVWRVWQMWKTLLSTDLGLLQQLNGQYGAEHCHVATKHLYSDVHVVWT